MPAGPGLADENAPGWPRRVCGKAYVASRLGLSTGNMTLIRRRVCGASMLREPRQASAHPTERALFRGWTRSQSPACDASQPTGRSVRAGSERAPPPINMARRPCAPSVACRRSSPRRGRRQDIRLRRPRCDRPFQGRRRPRRFR